MEDTAGFYQSVQRLQTPQLRTPPLTPSARSRALGVSGLIIESSWIVSDLHICAFAATIKS